MRRKELYAQLTTTLMMFSAVCVILPALWIPILHMWTGTSFPLLSQTNIVTVSIWLALPNVIPATSSILKRAKKSQQRDCRARWKLWNMICCCISTSRPKNAMPQASTRCITVLLSITTLGNACGKKSRRWTMDKVYILFTCNEWKDYASMRIAGVFDSLEQLKEGIKTCCLAGLMQFDGNACNQTFDLQALNERMTYGYANKYKINELLI